MASVRVVEFAREDIGDLADLSPSSKEGMVSKHPLIGIDSVKSPVK